MHQSTERSPSSPPSSPIARHGNEYTQSSPAGDSPSRQPSRVSTVLLASSRILVAIQTIIPPLSILLFHQSRLHLCKHIHHLFPINRKLLPKHPQPSHKLLTLHLQHFRDVLDLLFPWILFRLCFSLIQLIKRLQLEIDTSSVSWNDWVWGGSLFPACDWIQLKVISFPAFGSSLILTLAMHNSDRSSYSLRHAESFAVSSALVVLAVEEESAVRAAKSLCEFSVSVFRSFSKAVTTHQLSTFHASQVAHSYRPCFADSPRLSRFDLSAP